MWLYHRIITNRLDDLHVVAC